MKNGALIVAEKLDVTVVFSDNGMTKLLDEIKAKVISHVPDTITEQGRKDIASLAYKITRSKTLIDDLGKGVVSDWKKKAKLIDGHRKTARDFLDDLKDTVRQPLTDWEAEQAIIKEKSDRKEREKIDERLKTLASYGVILPFMEVATLDDDEFGRLLAGAIERYEAEQKRIADEEAARKIESERLEKVRLELEIETKRLSDIQAAQKAGNERIRLEQEKAAKAIADERAALQAEKLKMETAKIAEQERKDRAKFEEEAAEKAKLQAEADASEKMLREKKEEAERMAFEIFETERKEEEAKAEKARQEEMRPDKERLIRYAATITTLECPDLKGVTAQRILLDAQDKLGGISHDIMQKIKEL